MPNKNEDIHLWLLEQNRKKSRARLLEEADGNTAGQPVSILNHPWFNDGRAYRVEIERPTFFESIDLDQLLKEKAESEEEFRRLDVQIKALDLRARELCKEIIQETKKRNVGKRHEIERLREKIALMQPSLENLPQSNVNTVT